jgi:hypothetical protein
MSTVAKMRFLKKLSATLKSQVKRGTARSNISVNGGETVLPMETGNELIEEILYIEERMFGLTIRVGRELAYYFLKANPHLKNPFSKMTQLTGKKWYYAFMKRHPELSLRQPQICSLLAVNGLIRKTFYSFLTFWRNLWMKTKLTHNASIMWMNQGLLRFRRNPCGFVWV